MKSTKVSSVMKHTTVSITPDTTLKDVADILVREEIGCLVVRGTDAPAGVVSERDLVRAISDTADMEVDRASDVMAYEVLGVDPDDTLEDAARLMLDGGIRHLPVLKDGHTVVGMISIRDVLAKVLD